MEIKTKYQQDYSSKLSNLKIPEAAETKVRRRGKEKEIKIKDQGRNQGSKIVDSKEMGKFDTSGRIIRILRRQAR